MNEIKAIAAFCGSKSGRSQSFEQGARELGRELAARGIRLVFGGGRIGMMGALADSVLDAGGRVTGVIPDFLKELEVEHTDLTDLIEVPSMHVRKETMFRLSDAFVILPGGLGTLDECLEIITWKQLHLHAKPVVIFDIDGYWEPLLGLVDATIDAGFAHPKCRELFGVAGSVTEIFDYLGTAPAPDRIVLESHL